MRMKMMAGLLIGALLFAQGLATGTTGISLASISKDNANLQMVVAGNTEFALEMYKQLSKDGPDKNAFFSPFSISSALSMTYAGAREMTEKQMADTMRFRLSQTDLHPAFGELTTMLNAGGKGYRLEVANALWGQQGYGFQPEFLALIKKYYNGGFNTVDFVGQTEASRGIINRWVEKNTADKIKDLLGQGSISPLTRLVLTNAIYFKGDWATKFKPADTKPGPFQVTPDTTINVPMMNQNGNFLFVETDAVKLLQMPYVGGDLSMVVLLPKTSMAEFGSKLDVTQLEKLLSAARMREVDVSLPKFKFEAEYQLKDLLMGMGMIDAFTNSADFSGINGRQDLLITKVIHKAIIEVNEEGSEAAAATAVVIGLKSVMNKPEFKADRPFLFLIRHNATGSILFFGRVSKPEYK